MAITLPSFFFILFLGALPSVLWLIYYLRKDVHPEPKEIILQCFLIGFLLPPFVGFAEILLQRGITTLSQGAFSYGVLILMAALWEEGVKYLGARTIFHHEKEFDEMTDGMVYLIAVALGFSASENIIISLTSLVEDSSQNIFFLLGLRAVGANLLHTLASGMLGYFLARGLFLQERFSLLKGLGAAVTIHSLFNWLLLQASEGKPLYTLFVFFLLIIGLSIIMRDFHKLKLYDNR